MSILRNALVATAFLAAPAAFGDIFFFTNHANFRQFNVQEGKFLKGIETFEESTAGQNEKQAFPNPLVHGVPRPTFPNGIDEQNLLIQTNIIQGPCPPAPNPSANPNALFVSGINFLGSNSIKVGNDEFLNGINASLDLIFFPPEHTGVGFEVSRYQGFGDPFVPFLICVYDSANNVLGNFVLPMNGAIEPSKVFFGVWSNIPIARINIWQDQISPFAVDNIEMWVPAPGAAAILGLGGLVALRRRR